MEPSVLPVDGQRPLVRDRLARLHHPDLLVPVVRRDGLGEHVEGRRAEAVLDPVVPEHLRARLVPRDAPAVPVVDVDEVGEAVDDRPEEDPVPVGLAAPGLGLLLRRAEAGLGPPLLGHVARDPDEPDDDSGLVVERDLRGREADVAAVRRRVLVLLVVERPAGLHHGPVRGVDLARERLGERVVDREPDGVLGALVPDGPGVGEVADDALPLPVADEDGVRDGVDDRPEQALAGLDLVAPIPERLARPDLGHGGDPRQPGQDDVVAPEEGAPLPRRPGQDERRQERDDEHAHGRPHPPDRPGVRGDGQGRRAPGR